jgi:hypothetical protein
MRKIVILVFLTALFLILIAFRFIEDFHGISHKASPKGRAQGEALIIAVAIKTLIEDEGPPKDVSTSFLTKLLLGNNPYHTAYLYSEAFRFNSAGQLCDPSGQPYNIKIEKRTITVESPAYSVGAKETY